MFTVVIEHLEPCVNRWILKEYEYAMKIYRSRLLLTNVKDPRHAQVLSKYIPNISRESAVDILANVDNIIVLDPKAPIPLDASELKSAKYVVIGGIMGSHPPRGRTWLYITSKLRHAKARNIGPYQYTIAGVIYVLRKIEEGNSLSEIKFVYGLRYRKVFGDVELEIFLPYAFPVNDEGHIVLPEDYLDVVAEYVPIYEQRILRSRDDSICYNG